jgi:hypothetical protein
MLASGESSAAFSDNQREIVQIVAVEERYVAGEVAPGIVEKEAGVGVVEVGAHSVGVGVLGQEIRRKTFFAELPEACECFDDRPS